MFSEEEDVKTLSTTVGVLLIALVFVPVLFGQVRQGQWTPVVESFDRGYSSISYWTYRDDGVEIGGGRISVEHGKPAWPGMLDEGSSFDSATVGKSWRLGNNKWTVLDTQLELRFGEQVVAPGIYYLLLERPSVDSWRLVFVSPEAVTHELIDAWAAQARPDEVPQLFSVPVDYASGERAAELDISLSLDAEEMALGGISIHWGPHRLDTGFAIAMVPPTHGDKK